MKLLSVVFCGLFVFAISCTKSDSKPGKICFTRTLTELQISNNTNEAIYFVSFSKSSLPLIDWAPICGNNNIAAHTSANMPLMSIGGSLGNDLLVVYWWTCNGNRPENIRSVTLDLHQTACR